MHGGSEQFNVVAFTEHHKRHAVPALRLPPHIGVLPWMTGYRRQAMVRIGNIAKDSGVIRAVLTEQIKIGDTDAWRLESDQLVELHEKVREAALMERAYKEDPKKNDYGTRLVAPVADETYSPHIILREGQVYLPGDTIAITEISVVGWVGVGLVVYKNIPLERNA